MDANQLQELLQRLTGGFEQLAAANAAAAAANAAANAAGAGQARRRPDRLTKIDASSYLLWEEQFRLCVAANGWNHATARREARMAMQEEAAKAVQGIPVGDLDDPVQPFGELLQLYRAVHYNPATVEAAWIRFGKTKQKADGESLVAWHSRVRYEFSLAYPDVPAQQLDGNRDLIRKFVHGIHSTEVADKTLMGAYQDSFAAALQLAIAAEASLMRPGRKGGHMMGAIGTKRKFSGDCFNCGIKGHRSAECRKPKKEKGEKDDKKKNDRGRPKEKGRGGKNTSPSPKRKIAAMGQRDEDHLTQEESDDQAQGN